MAPHDEESATLAKALTLHINDLRARHPDVDLDDEPEAAYGTDHRNMCGKYDGTGNHDPVMALCVAITRSQKRDDNVEELLLLLTEIKGDKNIFRRIGFFERGRKEDFQVETKTEISVV